jgi:hypothetical protein
MVVIRSRDRNFIIFTTFYYCIAGQYTHTHQGRLHSSWTHLITPSREFVEVRWRSLFRSTSLGKRRTSYNAPPTSRKRAADRRSLRNFLPRSSLFMVGKAQKSHGARSELYGGCSNGVPPIHFFQAEHRIQFRSHRTQFLGFSNHGKGAPRQEISKWSTVCSTFSRSGWSVVRSASLAKGGTSKKRPSLYLHKVPTRSNKVRPRTFHTSRVCNTLSDYKYCVFFSEYLEQRNTCEQSRAIGLGFSRRWKFRCWSGFLRRVILNLEMYLKYKSPIFKLWNSVTPSDLRCFAFCSLWIFFRCGPRLYFSSHDS